MAEGLTSGLTMLAVDIPSGYFMEQYAAMQMLRRPELPQLIFADTSMPGKTLWYFNSIPPEQRCFEHTVGLE